MGVAVAAVLVAAWTAAHAARLPVRRYTVADGLPRNAVNAFVQDSAGFVWFGTSGGLARLVRTQGSVYVDVYEVVYENEFGVGR